MTPDHYIWGLTLLAFILILARWPPSGEGSGGAIGEASEGGRRDETIDAAKGVAIAAVIGIHALFIPTWQPGLDLGEWLDSTLTNNILRFAVPLFLFFSGYCLRERAGGWGQFYKTKAKRIFLPYTVVSLGIVTVGLDGFGPGQNQFLEMDRSPSGVMWILLSGGAALPFYFIAVLAQLYIVYPAICLATRWSTSLSFWGSLVISAGAVWLGIKDGIGGMPLFFSYLFPFVAGIIWRRVGVPRAKWWLVAGVYFSANIAIWMAARWTGGGFSLDGWYTTNFQFFYSLAATLLVALVLRGSALGRKIFAPLGRGSLWIFLLHYPAQVWIWSVINPSSSELALFVAVVLWIALCGLSWIAFSARRER